MMAGNMESFLVRVLIALMIFEVPYFFLIAASLLIWYLIVICKRKSFANRQMLVLAFFIVLYFAIDTNLDCSNEFRITYILSAVSMYAAGFCSNFDRLGYSRQSSKIRDSIAFIAKTYFCYVLVSFVYNFLAGQFAVSRNPLNIWTGDVRAATNYGTMLVIPLAYGIFLLIIGHKKRHKLLGVLFIVSAVLFSIMTASRTILYFVPIGLLSGYCYNIKVNGRFGRKHMKQIAGIFIMLIVFVGMIMANTFNLQTLLLNSQLGQRYASGQVPKISEDGRMVHIKFLFSHWQESLFGGGYTRLNSGDLHNVYLNVYDLSGIIPFILMVIFSFSVLKDVLRLFRNGAISNDDKTLVWVFYTLVFIQLLMEPVMESVPVFFWCLLYISGMIRKFIKCSH